MILASNRSLPRYKEVKWLGHRSLELAKLSQDSNPEPVIVTVMFSPLQNI